MDKSPKVIFIFIISISAVSWTFARDQSHMMGAMMYEPYQISLFSLDWTLGMTAMMLPSIAPVIVLYNNLIKKTAPDRNHNVSSFSLGRLNERHPIPGTICNARMSVICYGLLIIIFVGSYLLIWTLVGIATILAWSIPVNTSLSQIEATPRFQVVFGIILIISGLYQLSPMKRMCLRYCECKNFFINKWTVGATGTARMGIFHGLGCVGSCWPYCLLMICLGWMSLLWMGLFACVIFAEKIWSRGFWVARISGAAFTAIGIITILGFIIIPNNMIM